MIMLDTSRHNAIFSCDAFDCSVHIIGCGGMGSRVAEGLTRMGVGIHDQSPIHLYDHDCFDGHNIANQWIDAGDVGSNKAECLAANMTRLNLGCEVVPHSHRVQEYIPLSEVVFICVDSMSSRRIIMEEVIERNPDVECVIETRMDAQIGISHCFDPFDKKQSDCWWLYWHSDEEADHIGGCSEPQSIISAIYGTTMLALKQFEKFARLGDTWDIANRVYVDFDDFKVRTEQW
jgi:ThiF family